MYDLGDPVVLSVTTTNAAGVAADPTTIVLTITLPDGTTATPTVVSSPVGTHTATYTTTQAGLHRIAWVATGAVLAAYADVFNVEAALWTGIVSLADVKLRLGKTLTRDDEELRPYVLAATEFVESKVGPVVRRTLVEKVKPQRGLLFVDAPVITLTTITDTYGYGQTYNVANFLADGRTIYPLANTLTVCYPVTVTYVGGRAIVPALIRNAALDYIAWLWESQRGAANPVDLATGGEFETFAPATVPFKILQALESFAAPGFA